MVGTAFAVAALAALSALVALPASADPLPSWNDTDAEREFAYDREGHIGVLTQGLDEAEGRGWLLVDMAEDWERIWTGRQ